MAYESKALLMAIYRLSERAKDLEEVKQLIKDIANAEGVVIPDTKPQKSARSAEEK